MRPSRDLSQGESADADRGPRGPSDTEASCSVGLGAFSPCQTGPGQPWQKPGRSNESDEQDTYDDEDEPSEEGGEVEDKGAASASRSSNGAKISKPRWAISTQAKFFLEQVYQMERFPSAAMRRRLAADFNVEPRQVQIWYQNRRQRDSRMLKATQLMPPASPSASGSQSTSNAEVRSSFRSVACCHLGCRSTSPFSSSSHARRPRRPHCISSACQAILHQLRTMNEARHNLGIHEQPGAVQMQMHRVGAPPRVAGVDAMHPFPANVAAVAYAMPAYASNVPGTEPPVLFGVVPGSMSAQMGNSASEGTSSQYDYRPYMMPLGAQHQHMPMAPPLMQAQPVMQQLALAGQHIQMYMSGQQAPNQLLQQMQQMQQQMQRMQQEQMLRASRRM